LSESLFQDIQSAIVNFDEDLLNKLTDQVLEQGIDLVEVIEKAYTVGIKQIGDKFEQGDIFLPELMQAGTMVKDAITRLEENVPKGKMQKKGKFLIGTVEGDIHDIGKDLVATMLSSQGIEVIDIGVDCPASKFVDRALEVDADIIGASCLLTMTAQELEKLMNEINSRGVRDRFKVMVGGAAVNNNLAEKIGADGYGADLKEAVDVALALLEKN
jgi:trimethylamine corrinoid protein